MVGVSIRVEKGLHIVIGVLVVRERVIDEVAADKEVGGGWTDDTEEEECERTSENRRRGAGVLLRTSSRAIRLVSPESYIRCTTFVFKS